MISLRLSLMLTSEWIPVFAYLPAHFVRLCPFHALIRAFYATATRVKRQHAQTYPKMAKLYVEPSLTR